MHSTLSLANSMQILISYFWPSFRLRPTSPYWWDKSSLGPLLKESCTLHMHAHTHSQVNGHIFRCCCLLSFCLSFSTYSISRSHLNVDGVWQGLELFTSPLVSATKRTRRQTADDVKYILGIREYIRDNTWWEGEKDVIFYQEHVWFMLQAP